VEELFFRGLLQRVLESSWPAAPAIAAQAVVFGLCHISPVLGLRNVSVVVGITAFGVVQGVTARGFRRLVPGMWAHAFFNLLPVVVIALR
jgi:membrane protease YdiL (CAAX protease family)